MIRKKALGSPDKDSLRVRGCRGKNPAKKKLVAVAASAAAINDSSNISRRRVSAKKPAKENRSNLISGIPSLLPPPTSPEKKTIFLELDNTLVHTITNGPAPEHYDFAVRGTMHGVSITWYVQKRPGVDQFLTAIARDFEVVAFTAGLEVYASLVLDRLDPEGIIFSHRLYRNSCTLTDNGFLKDLSEMGRDLGAAVIVDNRRPTSYARPLENAIPVRPYLGAPSDRELHGLIKFFEDCKNVADLRDAAAKYRFHPQ